MIWSGGRRFIFTILAITAIFSLLLSSGALAAPLPDKGGADKVEVILIAGSLEEAKGLAQHAGGEVTHELELLMEWQFGCLNRH
jgi:hypothetical protein